MMITDSDKRIVFPIKMKNVTRRRQENEEKILQYGEFDACDRFGFRRLFRRRKSGEE